MKNSLPLSLIDGNRNNNRQQRQSIHNNLGLPRPNANIMTLKQYDKQYSLLVNKVMRYIERMDGTLLFKQLNELPTNSPIRNIAKGMYKAAIKQKAMEISR